MPLLTNPTRPKPPRLNKRRQIPQQDSQTTLRDGIDEEPYMEEQPMDMDYAPPLPTKYELYDQQFEDKTLPITPIDPPERDYYDDEPEPMIPYSPPPAATYTVPTKKNRNDKPSTSQRWKTAVGKMFSLKKPKQNTREYLPPPPLSPASSRLPSVYGQPYSSKNTQPYRSAVTLLPAGSSRHGQSYYDDDEITNIGLSRAGSHMPSPITPITARGGISPMDHFEPITSVMRRADWPTSPITPMPYSPTPPSPVRQRRSSEAPPSTLRRDSSSRRPPSTRSRPSIASSSSSRTPSPTPDQWPPNPSTSRLYITNPSPVPTPSPPPMIVKHPSIEILKATPPISLATLSRSQTQRTSRTNRTKESIPPVISINKPKKAGPRILQAHLPAPVPPDPKHHVFTGPWYNRRGDEWLGISPKEGEYRVRNATDDMAFSPKFLKYPEEAHHFMNPMGDVMNAKTLQMVSKAPRV
jgi:hypothetical protein